LQVSDNWIV